MQPRLDEYRHYQQQPQQQQQQPQQQQPRPQRVLYMTRRPEQRPEQEQERVVVIIDDATLRLFVRSVYLYAIIFILVTSITWLVISGTKFSFYPAVPVPFFVWILLAFTLLMIMNCVPQTRYIFPLNWVMVSCIVILITFAGSCVMDEFPVLLVLAGLSISLAIVVIFYVLGAICPQNLLPSILCTAVISCILTITLIIFSILIIFMRNPIIGLVFAITLFCLVILMMPFHSQYIHGRLDIVPIFDMLHCSLSIYIHFTLILYAIGFFYFYHEVSQ